MSSGGSFSFNNNVSGQGANIAQGQNVTQNVTQNFAAGGSEDVAKIFNDMVAAADAEQKEFSAEHEEVADKFETPPAMLCVARDEAAANLAAAAESQEPLEASTFEEKKGAWMKYFAALSPKIMKVALASGKAALGTYASSSPVVAALKAAVDVMQE